MERQIYLVLGCPSRTLRTRCRRASVASHACRSRVTGERGLGGTRVDSGERHHLAAGFVNVRKVWYGSSFGSSA
jgi:hypothetical protein